MQSGSLKSKILNFELWFLVFSFHLLVIFSLCGCAVVGFLAPGGRPYNKQVSDGYRQTKLKESCAADVLTMIHLPEYELLSQSKSVVASFGEKKKGYKVWFKMVAFDENELTAKRKYLFIEDERPKMLFVEPWENLLFNCEMVLEQEVIDKPYANENAKRIAILNQVLKNIRKDIDKVKANNKKLAISGMMINQALETVLVKLDKSPVLATRLSEKKGLDFNHINFDKGKIQMVVEDDVVTVKMRLGSLVKKLKISFEKDMEEE